MVLTVEAMIGIVLILPILVVATFLLEEGTDARDLHCEEEEEMTVPKPFRLNPVWSVLLLADREKTSDASKRTLAAAFNSWLPLMAVHLDNARSPDRDIVVLK